jgi:hypothetical protein
VALTPEMARAQQTYVAQPDSPQWLKDRRYAEGAGIKTGDLELHPGIAGEIGYDSNWFLRSSTSNVENGAPTFPPIGAMVLRVTPQLYLSTIGPQRREGDINYIPPSVRFRAGLQGTYREFIGVTSYTKPPAGTNDPNDISKQRNFGGTADARLEIAPERPFGAALFASYGRVIQPNVASADPNNSFNRDDIAAGGEIIVQPGGGTLDWHFGYTFRDTIFEEPIAGGFDNVTHEASTRGRWKFRPRTALLYDATLRFISYTNPGDAANLGLTSSTPVRARLGLNGLVTDRFALLFLMGYGASFYDATNGAQPQYDSIIGQAEAKWFLAANPGADNPSELGLALSSLAIGYTRDFQNSYIASYYGIDRGYARFAYFFAGRFLLSLEGGVGAVEYPGIIAGQFQNHGKWTDTRADATLFGEYRLSDSFGINSTLRYTANFSSTQLVDKNAAAGQPNLYDLSWNRFEAYLGARWFM